jgi:signal peptidase I
MRPRRSLWFGLLAAGLLVAVLIWAAPPQLGGSTTYSSTVGTSMEPMFHKGDLALVRPAANYKVGDIALYQSPVVHRPVLHRIIVIQSGRYYFQGDNNDFVDPGFVTRDEISGKLWIHLPKVGIGLSWVGKPSHAAGLAGIAMLVLFLGGSTSAHRGRRRRRRRGTPDWKPPVLKIPTFSKLRRPRRSPENIALAVALTAGLLALLVGFTTPVAHTIPSVGAYNQTGTFSYSSTLDRPDSAYPDGVVTTGQPVFLTAFTTLDVAFAYRFASQLSHHVTGTIGLDARLSSTSSSWTRTYVLEAPVHFQGDVAHVTGTVDLHKLRALTEQIAIDTGVPSTGYDWTLQPTVRVRGVVAGKQISKSFAPTLPFTFSSAVLALNAPAPTTLPGASYDPPTTASTNETALQPVLEGSLPVRAPNTVSLVKFSVAVSVLRGLGLALAGLALLGIFTKPLRRQRETWSNEKRIAFRVGCIIVDVVSLESAVSSTGVPTALPDFESLAHFARYLERPILRDALAGAYAVEDSGRLYVFRKSGGHETAPKPETTLEHAPLVKASATGPRPARRRRTAIGVGGVIFATAVVVGLVTSFTATSTVPMSRAGVSSWTKTPLQLAPMYCSSLALTKLVVATSSTVTGTTGSDLVLGRNTTGAQTLNGGLGDDCIIAGGSSSATSNTIDGGAGTDICIGAPATAMTFANCEYTGTPSTGHSVGFSSWQGFSGTALTDIPTYASATTTTTVDSMETPVDRGDNLGSRLQAYLTPPASGNYTFWMASDDNGRLFLSTNADPANRVAIASVPGYAASEAWDASPSQQSSPIALVAGQKYYIEAWAKEAGGGDNLAVAWSGPTISRDVISGDYLSTTAVGCSGWCPADGAKPYRAQLTSFASKCADVLNGLTADASPVGDYPCSNGSNQAWTLASNGSLQVYNSVKCLAPKNASITADTLVVITACNASAAQTWTYASATGLLKLGSLCLEVPGANSADGVQLTIDTCDGQPEQRWAFAAGSSYTPTAPSGLSASTTSVTGTSCADCTVKVYRSTGGVGAAGPGSTLVGTVTATATGAFTFAPAGSIAVGNNVTATSTTPLAVTSPFAPNVRSS